MGGMCMCLGAGAGAQMGEDEGRKIWGVGNGVCAVTHFSCNFTVEWLVRRHMAHGCVVFKLPTTPHTPYHPQDYYPEHLGQMFIINTPFIFKTIWAMVNPMLEERTRKKIQVLG